MIARVLIISNNSFSNVYNNGKTLEALFSAFPKDNLAQLYFHEGSLPDFTYCNKYWKISEMNLIKSFFKRRESIGNEIKKQSSLELTITVNKYPHILHIIKNQTGNLFRDILWTVCRWESPALIRWIKNYNPHVIFFVGSSASFSSKIALRISSLLEVPLAVYYTDDYLFSLPQNNFLQRCAFKRVETLYKKVIDASTAQFAIGSLMSQEYSRHFKKDFIPIMNAVPIMPYKEYQNNHIINMVYFGGLHLNRWRMISRLATLLPNNCNLIVYSAADTIDANIKKVFDKTGVQFKGALSGDVLRLAMIWADILLHVESDDNYNRRFTRLAVSTKIPEYLITGRPILGFGPGEVASMRILSDNGVGIVISSDSDDETVRELLYDFVNNYKKRAEIGLNGYNFAKKEFDIHVNSHRLMNLLSSIV